MPDAPLPDLPPIPPGAAEIAALQASRRARRGNAPMPAGSLFDDVERRQKELF